MALELSYTKPETGAPSPKAYIRIEDASVMLLEDKTTVIPAIYHSKATATAGLEPVTQVPMITLPRALVDDPNPAFVQALAALVQAGKIASPRDALKACLYVLLKSLPDYADAQDV